MKNLLILLLSATIVCGADWPIPISRGYDTVFATNVSVGYLSAAASIYSQVSSNQIQQTTEFQKLNIIGDKEVWFSDMYCHFYVPVEFTNGVTFNGGSNYLGGITRFEVWDDLVVDGTLAKSAGSLTMGTGDWGTNAFLYGQYFKGSVANSECFVTFQMPHAWKQGQTNVDLHMHVSLSAAPSGANSNAVFQITYNWRNINEAITNTTRVYSTNGLVGAAWKSQLLDLAHLDGTGKTLSSILKVGIRRLQDNTSDNYAGDLYLDSVDLHIIKDSLGSEGEVTKY